MRTGEADLQLSSDAWFTSYVHWGEVVRKLFHALFVLLFLLGLASTVAANAQLGAGLQVTLGGD